MSYERLGVNLTPSHPAVIICLSKRVMEEGRSSARSKVVLAATAGHVLPCDLRRAIDSWRGCASRGFWDSRDYATHSLLQTFNLTSSLINLP